MKPLMLKAFCGCVAVAAMAVVAVPAFTDASPPAPLNVQVLLDTPKTIMQGEPILLHYTISNTTPAAQQLGLRLGVYGTDWYTLTLTDSAGKSATIIPDARPAQPVGFYPIWDGLYRQNQPLDDYIVVTRFLSVTHPGNYTLTAHVHLPYGLAPASATGPVDPYIAAGSTFQQDSSSP